MQQQGFWNDFRRFFVRGLAAVLPALLTLTIVISIFNFVQDKIGDRINRVIILGVTFIRPEWNAEELTKLWDKHWYLQAIGFAVAIIGIYFFGRFVASFIGRSIWTTIEQGLKRTPVIKQIFPSVKQVTDFLLSQERVKYSRVVAVEYPRKGVWSLGLVTGPGMRTVRDSLGADLLTVFIPSSPTPVTGYVITVRREEVLDLPLNIDEAFRFCVSGGVLIPSAQLVDEGAVVTSRFLGEEGGPAEDGSEVSATREREQESDS